MRSSTGILVLIGTMAAVAAGGLWLRSASEAIQPQVVLAARPAVAVVPESVAAASAVAAAPLPDDSPANILLIGTRTEPGSESATFVVDGETRTFGLGAKVAGSVVVIQRITAASVWMGPADGTSTREIRVKSAKEVAQRVNDARQATAAPADYGPRVVQDSQPVTLRDEGGAPLPPEMQVHVRRRAPQPAGAVGGL